MNRVTVRELTARLNLPADSEYRVLNSTGRVSTAAGPADSA